MGASSAAAERLDLSRYAWYPQPGPQTYAFTAKCIDEVFFGGARGGGKSSFLLGDYLQDVETYGENWHGIIFRRTVPELQEVIRQSHEIYPRTGAEWKEGKKEWHWPNGAQLRLRHLDRTRDAAHYQGHQYGFVGWDELTQWPDLDAYHMLKACLRWTRAEIPNKRIRATGNPGGPGHHAVKEYFIDRAPLGYRIYQDPETEMLRVYIPAKVRDNKILLKKDPGYVRRLKGVGSEALVRAWLDGDWNVVTGAFFTEFSDRHIIAPFSIPEHWTRFRAFDWGSSKPFAVLWLAVSDGTDGAGGTVPYPKGSLIVYREWYGASGPNKGLKLDNEQIARGILSKEAPKEKIYYSIADPAIFDAEGGPCIAEEMRLHGVGFQRADNSRIAGWQQIHQRLMPESAMLYIFGTCTNLIRTLPVMQHDDKRAEDIDTDAEDHLADALRYAVMSRPLTMEKHEDERPEGIKGPTFGDLVRQAEKRNRRRR